MVGQPSQTPNCRQEMPSHSKTRAAEFTEAHAVWLKWSCKVVPSHSPQPASECLPQHSYQCSLSQHLTGPRDRTLVFQGRPFYLWTVLAGEVVRLMLNLSASLTLANTWEVILCSHKEYVPACSKWQMFD